MLKYGDITDVALAKMSAIFIMKKCTPCEIIAQAHKKRPSQASAQEDLNSSKSFS